MKSDWQEESFERFGFRWLRLLFFSFSSLCVRWWGGEEMEEDGDSDSLFCEEDIEMLSLEPTKR